MNRKQIQQQTQIQIIVCRVGQPPVAEHIDNELDGLRKVIDGGYLQHIILAFGSADPSSPRARFDVLCDEDGIAKELPFNRTVGGHHIHGTFFICRSKGDEFAGVSDAEATQLLASLAATAPPSAPSSKPKLVALKGGKES